MCLRYGIELMNFTNPNAKKMLKGHKKRLIAGIVIMLIGAAVLGICLMVAKKGIDNPKSFSELTHKGGNSGEIVSLDVTFLFDAFASRENSKNENYCFATDGKDYFMVRVTEKELDKLQSEIEDKGTVTFYGVARKISDTKLIETACTFLNAKRFYDSKISSSNYKGYIGAFYLDYSKPGVISMLFAVEGIFAFLGIGICVVGLLFLLSGLLNMKKFKKIGGADGSEIARLDAEMNSPNALWLENLKIYATANYVIGFNKGINAVRYDEVIWFYTVQHLTNGRQDYRLLNLLDKTGVEKTIGSVPNNKKTDGAVEEQINRLEQKIWENNQQAVIGYSPAIAAEMKTKAAELKAAARR